jgi:hypothetical protein
MPNLPIEIIREIIFYISPNIDIRRALHIYGKVERNRDFYWAYHPIEYESISKTKIGYPDYRDLWSLRPQVLPIQYIVERSIQNSLDMSFRYPVHQDCVISDIIVNEHSIYYGIGIHVLRLGQAPSEGHRNIFPIGHLQNVYWSSVYSERIRL